MPVTNYAGVGKKDHQHFADDYLQQKNRRLAHDALHDIVSFHFTLQQEMQQMLANVTRGFSLDTALFEKMTRVQEAYAQMIHGFWHFDDERQSHALVVFGDAVQDLMRHIHRHKEH